VRNGKEERIFVKVPIAFATFTNKTIEYMTIAFATFAYKIVTSKTVFCNLLIFIKKQINFNQKNKKYTNIKKSLNLFL